MQEARPQVAPLAASGNWRRPGLDRIDYVGGERFVGIGQQHGNLPHLCLVQQGVKGRHAAQTDAIPHLPVGFPHRIVTDAHNSASVRRPELGRFGEDVLAKGRGFAVIAVASRAIIPINLRTDQQICGTRLNGRALGCFSIDARVQAAVGDGAFHGEWCVANGYRETSVVEVDKNRRRAEQEAKNDSEQKAHDGPARKGVLAAIKQLPDTSVRPNPGSTLEKSRLL